MKVKLKIRDGFIISLSSQVFILSVDTSLFYTEEEKQIVDSSNRIKHLTSNHVRNDLVEKLGKLNKKESKKGQLTESQLKNKKYYMEKVKLINQEIENESAKEIKNYDKKLKKLFSERNEITEPRVLNEDWLEKRIEHDKKVFFQGGGKQPSSKVGKVSLFESTLTRTLGIKQNEFSEDLIIVQTYYYEILRDLIQNGFIYKGKKYIVYTASAGQIRTKKTVFIREEVYNVHKDSLMCGISEEHINNLGGVNVNKFLAYLALSNSATDNWDNFNIKKSIVVDDFESEIETEVDFIDEKTFEITRKTMKIPINHTDGCGMILPRVSKKTMMVRLPWIKGLLVPFPFDKFIREQSAKHGFKFGVVKDIYGKEHNLINDNIEIIFTKSQFKMHKYYSDWADYQHKFIHNNCMAAIGNEEEDNFNTANLTYQILQTLSDLSDEEIKTISKTTNKNIENIAKDKETMLKVLGVRESNTQMNNFQKALYQYPELLADEHSKKVLKAVKDSLVKKGRSGKLDIDGKYTFIIPDLFAFCERLILGKNNPTGFLNNGQVYCKLYREKDELDCLRSPHLYREHAVRKNIVDKEMGRWFITKGLYTSCHDPISKLLMFDNDGDQSLVVADPVIIEAAKRNMAEIVPLFYNMAKSESTIINRDNIYEGLKMAYSGGNIGTISNNITKIWNSNNIDLEAIKFLCLLSNFTIDYAKTLYKPEVPKRVKQLFSSHFNKSVIVDNKIKNEKVKVPYFFTNAKDKNANEVEPINNSVVNKLESVIKNPRTSFKCAQLGKFDYRFLKSESFYSLIKKKKVKTKKKNSDNQKLKSIFRNQKIEVVVNQNQYEIDPINICDKDKMSIEDDPLIQFYSENTKGSINFGYDEQVSEEISCESKELREGFLKINSNINEVVDTLVEFLYGYKSNISKSTLWNCFGDVINKNIEKHLTTIFEEGSVMCDRCGARFVQNTHNHKYCKDCYSVANREKAKERIKNKRILNRSVV